MKKGWKILIKVLDGIVWLWNAIRGKLPKEPEK